VPVTPVENMKLVYTHPSHIVTAQAQSSIELTGIKCVLRNEYAAGAIGELAPIDTWPEVWVLRDRDYEGAKRIVERLQADTGEADWTCTQCGSASPDTFEVCWHCAADRYAVVHDY
jgi:hypothetical protein